MKRLYLIALFIIVSLAATAQENGNRDAQNRIVRGPYETNRFFDNIFVGVAGGVNIYFGEHDSYGKFGKRMAPALDIHVGKWFTPSIGARVGYSGLQAKGWTTARHQIRKGCRRKHVQGEIRRIVPACRCNVELLERREPATRRPAPGISYPSSELVGRVPTATTPTTTKSASTQVC